MVKEKSEIQFLNTQFVWENWYIEKRFKNYNKMEEATEKEKDELVKKVVLRNNFLLRRNVDLAFRNLIYSKIKSDKKIFLEIKRIFLNILSNVVIDQKEIDEFLGKDGYSVLLPTDSSEEKANKLRARHKLTQNYFQHLIDKKSQEGDYDSALILTRIKEEFFTGRYSITNLFASSDSYSKNSSLRKYNYKAKAFAIKYINNYRLYRNFGELTPEFHNYLNQLSDIIAQKFINSISNIVFNILEVQKTLKNLLHYIKLIKDLLAIASEYYFTKLPIQDQISLLNQKTDLGDTIQEYLDTNPKIEKFEWQIISLALQFSGYYDLALNMFLEYERKNKKIDDLFKYYLFDSIATLYKFNENYPKALEYYLKAHKMIEKTPNWLVQANPFDIIEIIKKNPENTPQEYKRAISLKNIGECYGHTGDKSKMILYFNKVEKIAKSL